LGKQVILLSSTRMLKRWSTAVRLVACGMVCAIVAACGDPHSSGINPTSTSKGSSDSTSTSPTTGSSTSLAPLTTTSARTIACLTSQLTVGLGGVPGGAGHDGYIIDFENRGSTCQLSGYPGVAGVNRANQQVVQAQRTPTGYLGGSSAAVPVVLGTGQKASALLEGALGQTTGGPVCVPFVKLLVTPPNSTEAVSLTPPLPLCYMEVHPVVAGVSGGASAP
jgi:hypothetical protein